MTGPLAAVATAAAHAHTALDLAAAVLTIVIAAAIIRRFRRHQRQRLIRERIERLGRGDRTANGSKQP